jgi:hypothetical protein
MLLGVGACASIQADVQGAPPSALLNENSCTVLQRAITQVERKQRTKTNRPRRLPLAACTEAQINSDQFFDWSTSLFLAIQGIMPRSSAPTVSIG